MPVDVTVEPPPPFIISAPNVFTPNNDGINDFFNIQIDGFVKFGSVKVFNRYGQLMFTTQSFNSVWDGTFNSKPLPAGTYYWMFEGTDQYFNTPIKKASSITIVRVIIKKYSK